MESPQPMSHSARRGEVEITGLAACPGCGWCAHAGAREELPDGGTAPADATLRLPGRGGCHPVGCTPWSWLVRARRGRREDTRQARRPGRGRFAHSGPRGGGGVTCRSRRPGQRHTAPAGAGRTSRSWLVRARQGGGRTRDRQAPRLWLVRTPWGEGGAACGWRRPGRCYTALAGAGW